MGVQLIVTVTLNMGAFSPETVKMQVANLQANLEPWAEEVVISKAGLMRDIWKTIAAVDTGSYRDSIRIQRVGVGRVKITVRAGGYIVNPKTGRLVDYAGWLELRYHFGQQAFNEVYMTVAHAIAEKVKQHFEASANRYVGFSSADSVKDSFLFSESTVI